MKPVIGASVHYVNHVLSDGEVEVECVDATITKLHLSSGAGTLADLHGPEEVDLLIRKPTDMATAEQCRHSEGSQLNGTWHWPH